MNSAPMFDFDDLGIEEDADGLAAQTTLHAGFDDEEYLTSHAMYHCWSDHSCGRRRPGRRRSTQKLRSREMRARR